MMEGNNDVFLPGGDTLVYLTEPVLKKYSTTFVWGHPFSMYVSYDQCFNHPPLPVRMTPPPFPQFHTYLFNSTKKQVRTFKYRIH